MRQKQTSGRAEIPHTMLHTCMAYFHVLFKFQLTAEYCLCFDAVAQVKLLFFFIFVGYKRSLSSQCHEYSGKTSEVKWRLLQSSNSLAQDNNASSSQRD